MTKQGLMMLDVEQTTTFLTINKKEDTMYIEIILNA